MPDKSNSLPDKNSDILGLQIVRTLVLSLAFGLAHPLELPRCQSVNVSVLDVDLSFLLTERVREGVLVSLLLLNVAHLGLLAGFLVELEGGHFVSAQSHVEAGPHFLERHCVPDCFFLIHFAAFQMPDFYWVGLPSASEDQYSPQLLNVCLFQVLYPKVV